MSEDRSQEIAALLQEGLDAYGLDDVGRALDAWRKVLAIDPDQAEALDYIQTVDRRELPREETAPTSRVERAQDDAVGEARRQIALGEFEQAFELLKQANEVRAFSLELEATIELVRSLLFDRYSESIGELSGVPTLVSDPSEIKKYNLPSNAGFLISLLDGVTDLDNLVTVSGMDTFEALRTTKNLIDVGIVTMRPATSDV